MGELLKVSFGAGGGVETWEGNPVLLDDTFEEDAPLRERLGPLRAKLEETARADVGETAVSLRSLLTSLSLWTQA